MLVSSAQKYQPSPSEVPLITRGINYEIKSSFIIMIIIIRAFSIIRTLFSRIESESSRRTDDDERYDSVRSAMAAFPYIINSKSIIPPSFNEAFSVAVPHCLELLLHPHVRYPFARTRHLSVGGLQPVSRASCSLLGTRPLDWHDSTGEPG